MTEEQSDTKKHDMRDMEFELLSKIHEKIIKVDQHLCIIDKRMDVLIHDMNTIHKFQRSFAERLSAVEKFCIERPLQSVSIIKKSSDNGGGI